MDSTDYKYLAGVLQSLPAEFFYEFPQLTEVLRLCEEEVEEDE